MKVALVHEWLTNWAGSENVLAELAALFPGAPIYTAVCDPGLKEERFPDRRVITSFIQRLPGAVRHYQRYLPLMPLAFEQFDLTEYDLVISSSHACAKGVLTRSDALHVCYCHTPIRYAWDMYHDYVREAGRATRMIARPVMHYLRMWDYLAAQRVDRFVANSRTVAQRIEKRYRRSAEVIHPPVDTEYFVPKGPAEDFYLVAGRLVPYKKASLAVEAFTKMGKPLVVIGDGPERRELERRAGPNVKFLGFQPQEVLREHYQRCRALIFPGEEDFGIVPVEVQACGRPVIAYGRGGTLDTVIHGKTGLLFQEQSAEGIIKAVELFERMDFDPAEIAAWAQNFSKANFRRRMKSFIESQVGSKLEP